MNIRVVKLDMTPVVDQLARIADLLEEIVLVSRPDMDFPPASDTEPRVFYGDDKREIVEAGLKRMGRIVYRDRK